jgi:hypothetical protein
MVALGLVTAVAVVGYLVSQGGVGGPLPDRVALSTGAARRLMAERPRMSTPATLEFIGIPASDEMVLTEGAAVPLAFRVDVDSRPVVLEERANMEIVLLYPPAGSPSVVVPASRRVRIEDPRGGTYVLREPAGPRRVRLIVFPPDVDPLTIQPVELSRLLPRLTIVERRFVAAPREESGE